MDIPLGGKNQSRDLKPTGQKFPKRCIQKRQQHKKNVGRKIYHDI